MDFLLFTNDTLVMNYLEKRNVALAGVAQLIEHQPANQMVPGVQVPFPAKAHAWAVGRVPSWGRGRGNQSVSLTHPCFFPSLSPFLPLSLKINKNLKKNRSVIFIFTAHYNSRLSTKTQE